MRLLIIGFLLVLVGCSSMVNDLKSKAKGGDPEAMYTLGLYYSGWIEIDGKKLRDRSELDYMKAAKYLSDASNKDFVDAQYALATLYEAELYIDDQNYLGKRCDRFRVLNELSDSYEQCMWNVPDDLSSSAKEKATFWYRKAAEGGHEEAMVKMSMREKTCSEIVNWLTKASNLGNYKAFYNLGVIHADLRAGEYYDPEQAKMIYESIVAKLSNKERNTSEELQLIYIAEASANRMSSVLSSGETSFNKTKAKLYKFNENKSSCAFIHER